VTFTASAVGNSVGTLTLTDGAANSPQIILLSGAAVDFSFQPAAGASTSATVTAGQTATYNLQIQGNQLQGNIATSCSGAPAEANCSLAQNIFVPNATPLPFQVQISTIGRSKIAPVEPGVRWVGQGQTITLFILALAFISGLASRFSKRQFPFRYGLETLAVLGAIAMMASCGGGGGGGGAGGGGGNSGTPSGTYTIAVTGQYNGGTRSMNLTLIVQ
jgi:hypothetical protein